MVSASKRDPERPAAVRGALAPSRRRRLRQLAAVALILGFAGCAGATTVGSIPPGYSAGATGATGATVVVGRIEMVRADGGALMPLPSWLIGKMTLLVQSERTAEEYRISCDASGLLSDFYVALPPGRYRLVEWKGGQYGSKVAGRLDVPARPAVYVGTLRFTGGDWPGWQRGSWSVLDAFDRSVGGFRERHPDIGRDVSRSLMELG